MSVPVRFWENETDTITAAAAAAAAAAYVVDVLLVVSELRKNGVGFVAHLQPQQKHQQQT